MAVVTTDIQIQFAKERRLKLLELRAAQLGNETPPHIATEIADLQRELAGAAPTTMAESHGILYDLVMETRQDVRRLYWLLPVTIGGGYALAIVLLALTVWRLH